jgi:ACR3 family arsenite efflux pump ArsB
MGLFERYLSIWVGLGILVGVSVGNTFPAIFALVAQLEYAQVNLAVALFIWVMIYLVAFANRTRHWFPPAVASPQSPPEATIQEEYSK